MNHREREIVVSRIISGCYYCYVEDDLYKSLCIIVKNPSREQRYKAYEVYTRALRDFELNGSYTDDELLDFLVDRKIWDSENEKLFEQLYQDVDDFKVKLYELAFKSTERDKLRKYLKHARNELQKLLQIRHSYDYLSAHGSAEMTRARYLIACSMHYEDGRPYYRNGDFWRSNDRLIEEVVSQIQPQKPSETVIRELARTEPWRSIWNCRKSEGTVFGIPSVDLIDEQRTICVWSSIYDSIYEHPEAPSEDIIKDDDILDGWLIKQRRKRDSQSIENLADNIIDNEQIKNAGEIFVPVNTLEDNRKIEELNSPTSRMTKRARLNYIVEKGVVREVDMPDTQMELKNQLHQMQMQHARGQ
jgi:hypothetical protein